MNTQDDECFLRSMGEQLEGYIPELPEQIEKLNAAKLGRAIVLKRPAEAGSSPSQIIGYMLPTNHNQSEHVLLFNTGDLLVSQVEGDYSGYRDVYLQVHEDLKNL